MRKIRNVHLGIITLVVALVGFSGLAVAHAQGFRSGTDVTVARGEVVDQTLFAAGTILEIDGTVNGDVFCAGQTVTISGTVNGDVICAAQSLTVSGTVNGSLRLAGQTVTVNGHTTRNASIAAQSLTVDGTAVVDGDLSLAAQSATLNGSVGRDLNAGSTTVTLNGSVGRDITAATDGLTVASTATVGGNIDYTSTHPLSQASGAHVVGTVHRHQPARTEQASWSAGTFFRGGLLFMLYILIAALLCSLVVVLLFPQVIDQTAAVAVASPWKTLGIGVLTSVAAPAVIALLAVTVAGLPLAFIAFLLWVLAMCIAWPLSSYYVGTLLFGGSTRNVVWRMLLGTVVLVILYFLPIIGFIAWLLIMWFGFGMLVLSARRLPRPHYIAAK